MNVCSFERVLSIYMYRICTPGQYISPMANYGSRKVYQPVAQPVKRKAQITGLVGKTFDMPQAAKAPFQSKYAGDCPSTPGFGT